MRGAAALARAAVVLVAVAVTVGAAAPAGAEFRYVPAADGVETQAQTDAGTAAERPIEGHADPAPGSGQAVWRIHAGEALRAALARWGARAGVDVTFLTDRRYRLDGAAAFEGAFPHAVEALFGGLAHLPHPPSGTVSADGRSLAVTHRARRAAEREGEQ